MNRFRWLTTGAAMLAMAGVHAQQSLPPDVNLFGGDLPGPRQNGGRGADKTSAAVAGYAQTLVFSDDRELRGELLEITADEIVWRRPDAGAALRFPRGEVRRILTTPASADGEAVPQFFNRFFGQQNQGDAKSGKPLPATIKLPGGDWLFGNVTSADGQSFTVQLSDGTSLPISRAQIEWLHFGATPVPAFGFSGTALDMEGWLPLAAKPELAGQTLTVKGASWIGRQFSAPNRFEVSFELPEDSEEGTRLWLQPFGPQPNCYGTGTTEIRFGRKDIGHLLFIDKFERQSAPLPAESLNDKGPGNYRVFYDGTAKRVIVWRNARLVGDWKYFSEKDPVANEANRQFQFNGFCFDRENRGDGAGPLKFNRVRIRPWDGVQPKEGETEDSPDRLSVAGAAEVPGKLESVTDQQLVFSGAPQPRQSGTMVRFFGAAPPALTGAETKLMFGLQGEFIARHLQVREGKVHGETSFSSDLELPLSALQNITFQAPPSPASSRTDTIAYRELKEMITKQAPAAAGPVDTLVFKNADELSGKALSASLAGPVRWRTVSGQEVEFQPGRIAGLRLAGAVPAADPKVMNATATVELRSGERVRGKLVAFDEKHVQLEHPQLGSIGLERSQLWHLFPHPGLQAFDGGRAPGGWTWKGSAEKTGDEQNSAADSEHAIYLDGTYVTRSRGYSGDFDLSNLPGVQRPIHSAMERFEIRVEAATLGGYPSFILLLAGNGDTSLRATVSYTELQLNVQHTTGRRRSPWRNISLSEKIGETEGRRALRLFVDLKAGTCDVVINGVHIIRIGQDESERLVKAQYTAKIQPYPNQGGSTAFSNIWIGPWNGELPSPANAAEGATALSNGDLARGVPKIMHEGKFTIDSELGDLDIPVEKTFAVDFGGAVDPPKVAARIRLADGTMVNVDQFQWDGQELKAHSATLGELRLPGDAVSELIYDPAPAHMPAATGTNKLAKKEPGEPTGN